MWAVFLTRVVILYCSLKRKMCEKVPLANLLWNKNKWTNHSKTLTIHHYKSDLAYGISIYQALLHQGYGFSSSHVWMWELDCEESWALKNWCFWTVMLEKTLESPLDCKEIQPVHPKGDQSWVFIRRTDVEAETPILWPRDAKTWLIGKDPDVGKDNNH